MMEDNKKTIVVGENLKANVLEDRLKQAIAESALPISTVYYLLNNLTYSTKELYDQQIMAEYNQYQKDAAAAQEATEPAKESEEAAPAAS